MGKFVIIRNEEAVFVTNPGSKRSYTKLLQEARLFDTRTSAEKECCGNERVVALEEAFR